MESSRLVVCLTTHTREKQRRPECNKERQSRQTIHGLGSGKRAHCSCVGSSCIMQHRIRLTVSLVVLGVVHDKVHGVVFRGSSRQCSRRSSSTIALGAATVIHNLSSPSSARYARALQNGNIKACGTFKGRPQSVVQSQQLLRLLAKACRFNKVKQDALQCSRKMIHKCVLLTPRGQEWLHRSEGIESLSINLQIFVCKRHKGLPSPLGDAQLERPPRELCRKLPRHNYFVNFVVHYLDPTGTPPA